MKLTIVGGGGVRVPMFLVSTLRRVDLIGLDEVCLLDIDPDKLQVMGSICRYVVETKGKSVRITTTTDPHAAFDGARYVVTTIRVGGDEGRILDEKIALQHGVLGQETTGPGGFAMSMRSIPAILQYADLLQKISPDAWLLNFTNPAGLVAQALHNQGFNRAIGICDGANLAQHGLARWLGVEPRELRAEVFGLNHLSWTRRVWLDDKDVLPDFLADPQAIAQTNMSIFDPALIKYFGMWLNEYLYYYYYADQAVTDIQADDKTRGEEVLELNRALLKTIQQIDVEENPQAALSALQSVNQRRNATYMHYARPDALTMDEADQSDSGPEDRSDDDEGEGYAGVALDIIEALETGRPIYIGLNVPNNGAIDCMRDDDVVEVSCVVDSSGVRPLPGGAVPETQELLMRTVKQYERLAVDAILSRSRDTAVMALMGHPLVLSFSLAGTLVDEYLAAHLEYIGEWW
ncbi:MAG: 6-phospho-beta-glucosidase [Chloroflexota bacterium]|nr:6-phospho-beta-glucosidase [Chloroflexota bacterium]